MQLLKLKEQNIDFYRTLEAETNSDNEKTALRQLLKISEPKRDSIFESTSEIKKFDLQRVILKSAIATKGILITQDLDDLLQERSHLINFPEEYKVTIEPQSIVVVKGFSSNTEEKLFQQTVAVLGVGVCTTEDMHVLPIFSFQFSPGSKENQSYATTLKYISISAMNLTFSMFQITLSSEAEESLRSILASYNLNNNIFNNDIYKKCVHFFQLFGSHVTIGPLHYGGLIVQKCTSKNFEELERDSILKIQKNVLMSSCDINNTELDKNMFKKNWSEKTYNETYLTNEILAGPKTASNLEEWKSWCNSNSENWALTDKGRLFVPVWELLLLHQHEEFVGIIDILVQSWERMTHLKASSLNNSIINFCGGDAKGNTFFSIAITQIKADKSVKSLYSGGRQNNSEMRKDEVSHLDVSKPFLLSPVNLSTATCDLSSKGSLFDGTGNSSLLQTNPQVAGNGQSQLISTTLSSRPRPPLEGKALQLYTKPPLSTIKRQVPCGTDTSDKKSKIPSGKISVATNYSDVKMSEVSSKLVSKGVDEHEMTVSQGNNSSYSRQNEMLSLLHLKYYYIHKLELKDALCIRPDIIRISTNGESCPELKHIPFLVLHRLMSYDKRCRSDLFSPIPRKHLSSLIHHSIDDHDNSESEDDEDDNHHDRPLENKIHPMDCLHALLLCCDDILRQDLFSRLAKCQLSVPFLMPDSVKKTLILPIWAMRSIVKEWTPHDKQEQSHPIVTYPMPIISFIRFGEHKRNTFSKSKTLNVLMTGSEQSPFFHYNCPGGQYPRVFSEGLVDISWYLPSGKPSDTFGDATAFLNLHGDAHKYPLQAEILTQISSLCFVLLIDEDYRFDSQDMAILKKLNDSPMGLHFLKDVKKDANNLKKLFPSAKIIRLIDKHPTKIEEAVCSRISKIEAAQYKSIEETVKIINCSVVEIDKNRAAYQLGFQHAQAIEKLVKTTVVEPRLFKKTVVPLQGPDLWQSWAKCNKELNRHFNKGYESTENYSAKIEKEKERIRKEQLKYVCSPTVIMKSFEDALLKLSTTKKARNYFLKCLSLMLNEHTGEYLNQKQQSYLKLQEELKLASAKGLKDSESKRVEYTKVQHEILEGSFGLENLLREMGQIYEAAHHVKEYKSYCSQLSSVMADLVIDGYPLELMDGDAVHVPLQWIKAVVKEVIKKIGDQRVYVLSVLGIQSSGKSTMLNAVFGLQFKVSAGRCTSGAFMQLIHLDSSIQSRTGCQYILVVDTEGLRAPELDNTDKYKHDNELATFVIGLANTTLINVMGENPGDMDDILQTSVHAFLRMTLVENRRSCQFIHQNATSTTKSHVSHDKFTEKLDQFTRDTAESENCTSKYHCFNDVIRYNGLQDKHYFPTLWKGDPPMAPIHEGYSEKAQILKLHIVDKLCQASSFHPSQYSEILISGQNLSSFAVKISSLWEALLKEDFIFCFKNTLEITAYNSLLREYQKWEWSFKESMIEWAQATRNEMKGCKLSDATALVQERQKELPRCIHNKKKQLKKEMDMFFKGKHHEILIQWKRKFEIKLIDLAEKLQSDNNDHCMKLLRSKKEISDFE